MRNFYDIVSNKECIDFGKKLGFTEVFFNKFKIETGKSFEENQKAVRKKIDILLDPVFFGKRNFDTAVAQIAKDNNVTIAFSLKSVLEKTGISRVTYLRDLQSMVKICEKQKNNLIIISGAENKYEMRNPEQLASIGALLKMEKAKQLWCVSNAYDDLI